MTDLTPMTALGGTLARAQDFGALHLAENPDLGLASLALRQRPKAGSDPELLGLALPGPGLWRAHPQAGIAAFWMGPDQWMIESPGRADQDMAAFVKAAAPLASVTEQTDAWVAFEITAQADLGSGAITALLEKLVNIDTADFGPGAARRTGFEHMSIFLIRPAENRLRVLGMRSAAASLWHGLERAAARLVQA